MSDTWGCVDKNLLNDWCVKLIKSLMSVEDDLFESKDSKEEGFKRLDQDRWRRGFGFLKTDMRKS